MKEFPELFLKCSCCQEKKHYLAFNRNKSLPARGGRAYVCRECRHNNEIPSGKRLKFWTPEEDKKMLAAYYAGGTGAASEAVGRSRRSVLFRLETLGKKVPKKHPWTTRQDKIIREYYPEYPSTSFMHLLPGRTPDAIRARARSLGIAPHEQRRGNPGGGNWKISKQKREVIEMALNRGHSRTEIAKALNVGWHTVDRIMRAP